jgi:hypothetical protein
MKAIGYIRVSTEEQADSGVSLEAQKSRVEAYCKAKGWELVRIIVDAGCSGKDLNRQGIQNIVERKIEFMHAIYKYNVQFTLIQNLICNFRKKIITGCVNKS